MRDCATVSACTTRMFDQSSEDIESAMRSILRYPVSRVNTGIRTCMPLVISDLFSMSLKSGECLLHVHARVPIHMRILFSNNIEHEHESSVFFSCNM
jgi:hypothetical protein